jgi:glycerol-3-phosphate dehydrogenase
MPWALVRRSEAAASGQARVARSCKREGVPGSPVVGGKITGYRAIAEEVGRLVARKLGQEEDRGSITQMRPLPGGHLDDLATYVERDLTPRATALGLDREQAQHLGSVYGSLAPSVLALAEGDPRLAERLCPTQPSIAAEIARAVGDEWATTLSDVLLRRTPIGLHACQGLDCLDATANLMTGLLGWTPAERDQQMAAYRREVEPMRRFTATSMSATA